MKNRLLLVLYLAIFISFVFLMYKTFSENTHFFIIFSCIVCFIPLAAVGFHPLFLLTLLQFLNFLWFRLIFGNLDYSIGFAATISIIPLVSLSCISSIKNSLFRSLYAGMAFIIVLAGLELIIRESPLENFLDIKKRIHSRNIQIDSYSNYLVNHDQNGNFIDSIGRKFPAEKQKGIYRIICLGSSSTEGHGAKLESYPARLENILNNKFDSIEVINAGIPGARFYSIYIYFKDILWKLSPDLLILYFGYNDDSPEVYQYYEKAHQLKQLYPFIESAEDLEYASSFRFCSKSLLKVYRFLFSIRSFATVKFTFDSLLNRPLLTNRDERDIKQFKMRNVSMLADYCKLKQIPALLIPEVIMYDNGEYAEYFRKVGNEQQGIYYYRPSRPDLIQHLTDSIHFDRQGYENLANQIASFLIDKKLIPEKIK